MIWPVLIITIPIAITIVAVIFDCGFDFFDYFWTWFFSQLLALLIGFLCCLVIDEWLISSIVDNEIIEEYNYKLYPFSDGEYVKYEGDSTYSYQIFEKTKGYLTEEVCSNKIYFIEIEDNETPKLVSYGTDYSNDIFDTLFVNWHSHYTFYIPELP